MADDIPDDIQDFDAGMLEWFYVEDDYPLAVRVLSLFQLLQRSVPVRVERFLQANWSSVQFAIWETKKISHC